ncbi:sec23/sec24 transport protein [Nannochloropsis gaditana]|uniref:Sec23/sec24 transport protein n=2 Tax=Nannochloropsis gaditana TaxID=72520 RepID=W7T565_9STRA|nr:sec23/sec24 transport protein [Nannochloropsis gaditana]
MTAGRLHYFPGPVASPTSPAAAASLPSSLTPTFLTALRNALASPLAQEAVMKIRSSVGLSLKHYVAPGIIHPSEELELAALDPSQSFVAEFLHDGEKIKEGSRVYLQLALLYTQGGTGQRMVRVHNLQLPTASAVSGVFRYADMEAIYATLVKQAVWQAWSEPLVRVREQLTRACVDMLYQYRQLCAASSPPGQLILPESLKLLPLYALALLKSDALRVNPPEAGRAHGLPDPTADVRAATLHAFLSAPAKHLVHMTYPRLYEVVGVGGGRDDTAGSMGLLRLNGCSAESLIDDGVFLLDAWNQTYLYVGRDVGTRVWTGLFNRSGPPENAHEAGCTLALAVETSDMAGRVLELLEELCDGDRSGYGVGKGAVPAMQVVVAGSGSPSEAHFIKMLVDDRQKNEQSYVEYLCLVHKQIQNRLAGR